MNVFFVYYVAIVNKLLCTKYDVLWMSNGDIVKMKKEFTSQLLNKVGMCIQGPPELGLIMEQFLYLIL